jgi:hypothetical protein
MQLQAGQPCQVSQVFGWQAGQRCKISARARVPGFKSRFHLSAHFKGAGPDARTQPGNGSLGSLRLALPDQVGKAAENSAQHACR